MSALKGGHEGAMKYSYGGRVWHDSRGASARWHERLETCGSAGAAAATAARGRLVT